MLAEIKGKISRSGSNLNDRLEDKLTGDILGALRYIPFKKVMGEILSNVTFLGTSVQLNELLSKDQTEYWDKNITFWPYHPKGELDTLIEFESVLIGLEFKLWSGLSSDDGIDNSVPVSGKDKERELSEQQLAIESAILKEWSNDKQKPAVLVFIAPEDKCSSVAKETVKRRILEPEIGFGYLSWEEILETLKSIVQSENLNDFERLIISDQIKLLRRKGLERFRGFNIKQFDFTNESWKFGNFEDNMEESFSFEMNIELRSGEFYEFSR